MNYTVNYLKKEHLAKEPGKHRATISRKIKRGIMDLESPYTTIWKYCTEVA